MKINYQGFKQAVKSRLSNKAFSLSLVAFVVGISIFAYGAVKAGSPTDCDSNAIIRCGVYDRATMTNQYNANTNGVKDIYNHFQINGDFSGTVDGYVTKDNRVIVNNQVVATNALTVGRENIGNSEVISLGGRTFYKRQPSVSFASSSISAYVKIVNGQFKWAVLKSCGNPVWATPTGPELKPDIRIKKYVGSVTHPSGYNDADSTPIKVNAGDNITYKIDVTNVGNGVANNLAIADQVEANIGSAIDITSLRINTANVPGAKIESRSGKKWIVSSPFTINPGESKYIEFRAKVKTNYSGTFNNIACVASTAAGAIPLCNNAKVEVPRQVTPPPPPPPPTPPSYSCQALTIENLSRTSFKFNARGAAANGAVITGYIFKVNGATVYNGSSSSYTYNQTRVGSYSAQAFIKTNKGTTALSTVCTKSFSVAPAPEKPSYIIKKYVENNDAQNNTSAVTVDPTKPFTYRVVVKNTSKATTISSIKVWDVLPAGVSYLDNSLKLDGRAVSNDADFFNANKGVAVNNLAAGKEAIFSFEAKLNLPASTPEDPNRAMAEMCKPEGSFYNNVAKADPAKQGSGESESDLPQKEDPAVIKCRFTPQPKYIIKKYVESRDAQTNNDAVSVGPNQPFTYKVVVENTGNVALQNVKVWDVLPAGVSYLDNSLKLNGQTVSGDEDFFDPSKGVNVSSIGVAQKVEFTFEAKIAATSDEDKAKVCDEEGSFYNNIAKADPTSATGVASSNPELNQKQDPAVIKCTYTPPVKHPSVVIEKEVSQYEVAVGEAFTWYLTVTNNGDVDLKDVVVSDRAPANTEFISSPAINGITIDVNSKEFKATIAQLKVGQKVTFGVQAKLTAYQNSDITNTACVNAPEVNPGEPNKEDDCDDARVKPFEKCTVPGKEDLDKNDPNCKEMCKVPGKENLAKNDPNCKDENCIEVNGRVISTVGKDGCTPTTTPTKIATPNATPNTGLEAVAATGATISFSAAAYAGTLHIRKRSKKM